MTSFSKPVRMLKSIASRSSLRSAHARRPSAVSVHSTNSQQEDEVEHHEQHERHEPNVKEVEERGSMDTDYGKEITRREVGGIGHEGEGKEVKEQQAVE